MAIVNSVGVIGSGLMGGGIAQVCAAVGIKVRLYDLKLAIIEKRLDTISKSLGKQIAKGRIDPSVKETVTANITPSLNLNDMADCDLIIEAVAEKLEIKKDIFSKLDKICKPETILASNTSSLPIVQIAAATNRPDKVIGAHFSQPVPTMKSLEIIRALPTSDETYNVIHRLALDLNKVPVCSADVPGFISNRVLEIMVNEAICCVYEGVGTIEDVDKLMTMCANHPMGPLTLADFIGLDTVLHIMEVMYAGYGDPKYRPCPLLRQYVDAGWLGRKTGRGFFVYD